MTDTVTKALLRQSEEGPVLSGNAGDFLGFGPDGRTVQGFPAPSSGGGFASGPLAPAVVELSDTNPSPQNVVQTLAAQADVAGLSSVTVTGWGTIALSADETGSPALSDGSLLLEVSWDGGATYVPAGNVRLWGGGGSGNTGTLVVPLFASSKAGPATGDVLLRITLAGEPVGGSEALTISLTSDLGAVFQ